MKIIIKHKMNLAHEERQRIENNIKMGLSDGVCFIPNCCEVVIVNEKKDFCNQIIEEKVMKL